MDDYFAYLELAWKYFPYVFYTFVLLTFLPKSLRKMKKFADADYEMNRRKYHRCYGPELCCHNLIEHEDAPKAKPRKAVTRGYLRKQQSAHQLRTEDPAHVQPPQPPQSTSAIPIKRQVQVSAIQTNTNVNQIAKMFESGSGAMAHRKINRVLPEIRTSLHRSSIADIQLHENHQHHHHVDDDYDDEATSAAAVLKTSTQHATNAQLARLLHENLENSMNLLHQQTSNGLKSTTASSSVAGCMDADENWQPALSLQRRTRAVPSTLTYAGTSATPSTSSPHSCSPSPPNSPVLRVPPLNLKTSVEDIFAAIARSAEKNEEIFIYTGCNTLSPVTSIDDILSQRRLSRPLSAYSISDLLNEESNFNKINNTEHHHNNSNNNGNIQHQDASPNVDVQDENLFVDNLLLTSLN